MKWRFVPLLLLLVLCVPLYFSLTREETPPAFPTMVGKETEGLLLPSLKGAPFNMRQYRGQVVFINVFASWCTPCVIEHKVLMQLAGKTDIVMIGIGWRDSAANIKSWLELRGNPFDVVALDAKGDATLPFGLSGVPESYIIDKNGVVAYHHKSVITEEEVDKVILPLLEKLNAK